MSKFGYQPKPNPPPDFDEFLQYQRQLNSMIRNELHTLSNATSGLRKPLLEEENKISTDNNKDGKLRNRNRSVKGDVYKQRGRKTTGKRKSNN
jgi:hypothetical protein